jgi:hypothetical protein
MVNGTFNLSSNTGHLGLERRDPRVQLLDGKGIEILARQCDDGIVGTAGQVVFRAHGEDR